MSALRETRGPGRFTPHMSVAIGTSYLLLTLIAATDCLAGEGPRMLLDAKRLKEIQAAVKVNGSTHQKAWQQLQKAVAGGDAHFGGTGPKANLQYARSYLAPCAGMAWLISGDKRYPRIAYKAIEDMCERPQPANRMPWAGYGLSRATLLAGMGVAYDWCREGWSEKERAYVQKQIKRGLDAMAKYNHANFGGVRGSNWVSVCRGGEVMCIIGARLEKQYAKRLAFLKREMMRHFQAAYDDIGYGQEGLGYVSYGLIFGLPCAYAFECIGDDAMVKLAHKKHFYKQNMFAGSTQLTKLESGGTPHRFIMSGVCHSCIGEQGFNSLVFHCTPAEHKPHYKYWYDGFFNVGNRTPPEKQLDSGRIGLCYALIYYPEKLKGQDPAATFGHAINGHGGMALFRNRWKDVDDIQVGLEGDSHGHTKAWDQPTATQLNVMGFDTRFFGGPGKTRDNNVYSCVTLDGKTVPKGRRGFKPLGKLEHFERHASGGYAIADGGSKYKAMGGVVKRHLLVDFSGQAAPGLISTLDRKQSGGTLGFLGNLADEKGRDPVPKATQGKEGGRGYFLLKGPSKSYLKGWVIHPARAILKAADPLTVSAGKESDLWIVMAIGKGTPPRAEISGEGLASQVRIGKATVSYDKAADRIRSSGKDVRPGDGKAEARSTGRKGVSAGRKAGM